MKISDGFDARRLRSKSPRSWGSRVGAAIAAVMAALGILLAMAGIATLAGHPPPVTGLDTSITGAAILGAVGLALLYVGLLLWRRCRRRMRRGRDLDISPHLMKKHD